ncbi:dTDP-4-dehydrorhamnose reductase [Maribacter sp. R77961]|uniref:dTDP-4-dehydrorhamnose reductase n=1 Tax=Maribacter sp. R77961 TaxID=3093871 RepID=UPI0037CAF3E1
MKLLVTGANGQLGKSFRDSVSLLSEYEWHFKSSSDLDITDKEAISILFDKEEFDYCINCAAYTAVDKAETNKEQAFLINSQALKYLAENCEKSNCVLIHVSTDFVFNGLKETAYTELDETNPINEYGKSKLQGEENVKKLCSKHYIIRTSWVYSNYGNNFLNTMVRLAKEREELNIVNDQFGTPTFAGDIAKAIVYIIQNNTGHYGVYHYSNEGETSWFGFAQAIFNYIGSKIKINPVSSNDYVTAAKRPKNSVLNKDKIKITFQLKIPHWKDSLEKIKL